MQSSRSSATQRRREEILTAALRCFAKLGYAKTTMEDIRRAARASTGSIYHHFKSREQLFAELYMEGVRDSQRVSLEALRKHRSAEQGIRALVSSYLEWVDSNPEFATYLLSMRHAEFMSPVESALAERNREFAQTIRDWMRDHVAQGRLPPLDTDLYWAILVGPSDHFARRWLAGQTRTKLARASAVLGAAAWGSLQQLLANRRPPG